MGHYDIFVINISARLYIYSFIQPSSAYRMPALGMQNEYAMAPELLESDGWCQEKTLTSI